MKDYLKAQSKLNKLIIDSKVTEDELGRLSASDCHWADARCQSFRSKSAAAGDVYQFEFGKNYAPEMSYEHRGLVLRANNKLLYVVPICSYDSSKHKDVYHPTENPNQRANFYLLKNTEYDFISRDSVIKLNDLRSVSIKRILYQHNGRLETDEPVFIEIRDMVFARCFPFIHFKYHKMEQEQESNKALVKELREKNASLEAEIEALKKLKDQ